MPNPIVIRFHHVSKRFLTGSQYYPSLRDWIATFFSKEFFKGKESFYALDDIHLTIRQGEAVGFIGSNGAGKSTLLKMISNVVAPTSGTVITQGRVAGLLELGAGFHPELTGRENIFFQGTILGMSKNEIMRHTDSIIQFAELEQFIDSAVKHYSSGMEARLGFAIAIHLDPDILLIDEVLAVGDVAFKKKCYEKIKAFSLQGKTVIMVSHSPSLIAQLCHKVYWIEHGKIMASGPTQEILDRYLQTNGITKGV